MKILIVANNIDWKSLDRKLEEVKSWYAPKVLLSFSVTRTSFEDIPFVPYTSTDPKQNAMVNLLGVDPAWYDANITPLSLQNGGYDIVMLVLPRRQWKEPNRARGWRMDSDQGVVQLQISCDEDEKDYWAGLSYKTPSFFQICRHEIMHALYMISGQWDSTHFYWDMGRFEWARDSLVLNDKQRIPFLQRMIAYAQSKLAELTKPTPMDNREKLYEVAKASIGTDASPEDNAPDELACAESVNEIYRRAFGKPIGGTVSTNLMYKALKNHPDFKKVTLWQRGDIIISPTGYGDGRLSNGHVGIMSDDNNIMSNNSSGPNKGKWTENFTIDSWINRYRTRGGYPIMFFRPM